ncbi:hypothetical protein BWK60_06545 [Flavobacterium covae]|uniref:DUF1343 domain-containing protein n=1 Tax=Flavobacterium columnare TaxID=996 RepID=A0AA94F3V7_9FLAO|nr:MULTISPECIES: DUF1343 domain-containing protein [Flavobacterium]MCH4830320.1 DUF1343 domain-containing protein [Flavobacterium columnare]MCH4832297.1 DUF1343 domain-containing protein [Flavobacterium columnare]OWP86892.1 hypothetical protein BWK60_06545 [Flavobacterium covae]QYS92398.1 DUF1343 domain-containing protein [Flavobacterium covae]
MVYKLVFKNTFLFLLLTIVVCGNCKNKTEEREYKKFFIREFTTSFDANIQNRSILTGADNSSVYLPLLRDKKVGIVTNQTGILQDKTHLVDFLIGNNINLQKIYAPEHGFRGTADAGELIKDGKDIKTGLPIISLYGSNKKPNSDQLTGIEIMVFDLQDVGVRFYTYISSLHYVMEACAENNIPLLVLDRPNPNGGIIDGPTLDLQFKSFVGMHPVPVLHGMTIGEYAKMINGEKWLKNGIVCNLKIISCKNYNREMFYDLPIKPSPNLPNAQAINLYASLCFFEGTNVSVGRGTEKQFQIYGSPYLIGNNFIFTPLPNLGAKDPIWNGRTCYGEDLTQIKKVKQLELKWLIKAYKENSQTMNPFFNDFFTKLAGNRQLQEQIENGVSESEIRKSWKKGLLNFKNIRSKYLNKEY